LIKDSASSLSEGTGPLVSVVIVALGDDPDVVDCLMSLTTQGSIQREIILVENGATGVPRALPIAVDHRVRRPENHGFTGGMEDGLLLCRGSFVLTLNPDATLLPKALERALIAINEDPRRGAIALRLERPGREILDSAGIRIGLLRRPRDRGMGGPAAGQFTHAEDVDAACMAAALFRTEALRAARDGAGDIVDRSFFAYKEDADLGWRIRRAGYTVRYEPGAVAIHKRGWREGMRKNIPVWLRVLSLRNRWLMILKTEPIWLLFAKMAIYVPVELLGMVVLLFLEPRVLLAYPKILANLGGALRRRPLPERTR
jgi:GT2 family glycosyltransferase